MGHQSGELRLLHEFKTYTGTCLAAKKKKKEKKGKISALYMREKTTWGPTWIDAKLTPSIRAVKDFTVNSGPSALSINHDRKSFYQETDGEPQYRLRKRSTNRLVDPVIPVLVERSLSLLDYWTKKLHSALVTLINVR